MGAELFQFYPILGDLKDCGPPCSSVWSGLLCPPPGGLPNPGIKPMSLMSPPLAGGIFLISAMRAPHHFTHNSLSPAHSSCLAVSTPLCCAQSHSRVQLCATPCTVACQAPLSMGILQARTLEWVVMPSSRRSSQPRD